MHEELITPAAALVVLKLNRLRLARISNDQEAKAWRMKIDELENDFRREIAPKLSKTTILYGVKVEPIITMDAPLD